MTRLKADLLLLVTAIVWGCAFVAQKTGTETLGPYAFVAFRFLLAALVMLPLVMWERKHKKPTGKAGFIPIAVLCGAFCGGILTQQLGVELTTVTNAGFLTGLYVLFTPVVAWAAFSQRPSWIIAPAAIMAIVGTFLLNNANFTHWNPGDLLILACAFFFAVHIAAAGYVIPKAGMPMTFCALQFAIGGAAALVLAMIFENITLSGLQESYVHLLYTAIVAGALAFSLQFIAQKHTPSSDAAIIMSGEALFAAIAGAIMLGDSLTLNGWIGCGLILGAILIVEIVPLLKKPVNP